MGNYSTPEIVWAICTIARSGSSWLSQLATSTGLMGEPQEYLLKWRQKAERAGFHNATQEEYLWHVVQTTSTPNGVFGIKGSVNDLGYFFEYYGTVPCVWLSRRDQVAQAVSWHRAHDGGIWTRTTTNITEETQSFSPSIERVLYFYDKIRWRESKWQEFFAEQLNPPMRLYYEDLCADPLESVRSIASFIGVDPHSIRDVDSQLQIVRDESVADLVERARAAIRLRNIDSV